MKKCCFVIPYFGKLPNYFQLFLNSCKYNQDYNWLLFTDDNSEFVYPSNIQRILIDFEELKKLFQSKFDFGIELSRPYKLCDYKPAYGYVFQDYLKEYKCWGHCDIDLIFGKISHFITDDMLDIYDKLFCLGHLVIYKNTDVNNRIFMSEYNGQLLYKRVFTTPKIKVFDEELRNADNVNQIFLAKGKEVFQKDFSMNIFIFEKKFIRVKFEGANNGYRNAYSLEIPRDAIYFWKEGLLCRYLLENNQLVSEEFLYIHLQKRKMSYDVSLKMADMYQIMPNAFKKIKKLPKNIDEFQQFPKSTICFQRMRLVYNGYMTRIKNKWSKLF